jgi:nucleoredoxin
MSSTTPSASSSSSSPKEGGGEKKLFTIESLLGEKLLRSAKTTSKPTRQLLQGKELLGLYFSASWCPPCKTFSPLLMQLYNAAAKDGKLEIVYVSSDSNPEEFEGYVSTSKYNII